MPLYLQSNIKGFCKLVIWNIKEDESYFIQNVTLCERDLEYLSLLKNKKRRLEFWTIRNILQNILNIEENVKYHADGKPFFETALHISISHTADYVAVGIAAQDLGIDIQEIRQNIISISSRVFSVDELSLPFHASDIEKATYLWTAKESLFKMFGVKNVDFKKDLRITSLPKGKYRIGEGEIKNQPNFGKYKLYFKEFDTFVFCCAKKK